MKSANQARYETLYEIAARQAGYFTTAQAKEAGFSQRSLTYYVKTERFKRIKPGLYRLTLFPFSEHEDLFIAWLSVGSRAVISHDSALALYDLSDALPTQIHLTIPRSASRRRKGVRLHTNRLPPEDVTRYAGLPVTTVPRTIGDIASGGMAAEAVVQAVRQAIRRGMTTQKTMLALAKQRGGRVWQLMEIALKEDKSDEIQNR
jgi:predicted transcriptional regulator of viral defense system